MSRLASIFLLKMSSNEGMFGYLVSKSSVFRVGGAGEIKGLARKFMSPFPYVLLCIEC